MKILHVIDKSFIGGGQACVLNLMRGSAIAGIETALVCRGGGPLVEEAARLGVRVHPVPFDKRFRPGPARALARVIEMEAPDVVHAHGLVATSWALLARAFGFDAPIVYHQHGFHHHAYRPWLRHARRFVEKAVARAVARVVPVSDSDAQVLVEEGYAPAERVTRIHYGIPRPEAGSDEMQRVRASLRYDDGGGPVVGIVSRLHPQKAVDVFLEAAARVSERCSGARFVVVGAGELESDLRALATRLGIGNEVTWAGGVSARPYLPLFDVAVLSSRWEGLPLVLLEYMAAGRAIVASAVGGSVEAVGGAAEVVPVGDAGATADAVVRLLDSPQLAEGHRRAARARYEECFTVDRMVSEFRMLYQEVAQ